MCGVTQDVLFEPGTYTCDSRHQNLIAFQFELGLLRRVLHAAGANDAESLEVCLSTCAERCTCCSHRPECMAVAKCCTPHRLFNS